jgi:hypothetical protein
MDRCRPEIAVIEDQIRSGHRDIEGLSLALADWSAELRVLKEKKLAPTKGSVAKARRADVH